MKIKYILLTLVLGSLMAFAPGKDTPSINWYDWNEGFQMASEKDRLILVDVYTNWCGWCKKMDRDTYSDTEVQDVLNKNFVTVKLNPEKTDVKYKIDTLNLTGYQLLNLLTNGQRTGYPTTIILDPKKREIVHAEAGYQDAEQFKKTIKQVLAKNSGK